MGTLVIVVLASQLAVVLVVLGGCLFVARSLREARREHASREDMQLVRASLGYVVDAQDTIARMVQRRNDRDASREARAAEDFVLERVGVEDPISWGDRITPLLGQVDT
jgi:hypothetical protein